MSRFVNNRRFLVSICLAFSLVGSTIVMAPQASYADTSWADLLKPLVKDVIVPGASMGMKKIMERSEKKRLENAGTSQNTSSETSSTSTADSTFSTPEEPVITNASEVVGTPEEPISTASTSISSAGDPPPPPPPPVATP